MKIVADYKKRKELKEYLPHHEHCKLKADRKSVEKTPPVVSQRSPDSTAAEPETRGSENTPELKRSLTEDDEERFEKENEELPSCKKRKYENGETETDVSHNGGSNGK